MLKNRIFLRGLFKMKQAFVGLSILVSLCHYQGFCHPRDEEMALANTSFKSRMADLQDWKTPFKVCGIWATGTTPGDSSLPYDKLPTVQIGGPKYGPQFFSTVETFLGVLPDNYSYNLILDQMTRITTKADLDRLQEKFGERFALTDIEELGAQLIEKFPQYKEALTDLTQNAIGGMPVLTSDLYRLIAMPYADKRDLYGTQTIRYLYLDIDDFVGGLSESKTLPLWLSKYYKTSSTDLTIYLPTYKALWHSELDGTEFFKPLARDQKGLINTHIGIEIPVKGQNQYETFVCDVLENIQTKYYSPENKLNIVKFSLKLYENLLAGNGMTFTGDLSEEMDYLCSKSIGSFGCIIRNGPGTVLFDICSFSREKFRIFDGPDYPIIAHSWVPDYDSTIRLNGFGKYSRKIGNVKQETFVSGYIKKAWGGRGITAVDKFLPEIKDREAIEFLYDSNYPYDG